MRFRLGPLGSRCALAWAFWLRGVLRGWGAWLRGALGCGVGAFHEIFPGLLLRNLN